MRAIWTCLVFLFLVSASLQAQTPTMLLLGKDTAWSSRGMMIMMGGDAGISTNALNVDFLQKSILGGRFERNELEELYDELPSQSKLGYRVHADVTFMNFADTLFGNPNLGIRTSLSTNYEGFCGFEPKAFGLVYLGNGDLNPGKVDLGELTYSHDACPLLLVDSLYGPLLLDSCRRLPFLINACFCFLRLWLLEDITTLLDLGGIILQCFHLIRRM